MDFTETTVGESKEMPAKMVIYGIPKIGKSETCEVPDIESVPDQFVRFKSIKEPNKILIKELSPEGNWYTIAEHVKLTAKDAM